MKNKVLNSGFTLIELLVSVFIMLMLLSVVLANFTGLSGKRNLKVAKNNLISDIRAMQSQSLSSKDILSGTLPASDYGVVLSTVATPPSSYSTVGDDVNVPSLRVVLSTLNLPSNVYVKTISITRADGSTTTANSLQVLFTIPYGRLLQTFSGGTASATKESNAVTTVTLSTKDNTSTATFVINGISGSVTP